MKGAVYYPARAESLYQAVQNISNNHFKAGSCRNAPGPVLLRIQELRDSRPKHSGGRGKRYFESAAAALGIVDAAGDGAGLVVVPAATARPRKRASRKAPPPDRKPPPREQQQQKKKKPPPPPGAFRPPKGDDDGGGGGDDDEEDDSSSGSGSGSSFSPSGSVAEV
jgi:hypothetical protein